MAAFIAACTAVAITPVSEPDSEPIPVPDPLGPGVSPVNDIAGNTLSMVRSRPMRTEVRTEPNPQVLGSVLCEGGPDPYFQVRGPSLSGPDLRVEPGSDLVQTSKWKEISESKVSE